MNFGHNKFFLVKFVGFLGVKLGNIIIDRKIDSLAGSFAQVAGRWELCLNMIPQNFDFKRPTHTKIQI
jgi:hypothetical protein